jgi:transcriptional regulator with XRE-family HTH domain
MSESPFADRFGALIRRRRRELDITQEQLAVTLGISQPAISSWEHGGSTPTAEALLGLLRALQLTLVDVVELLEDTTGDEETAA